MRTEMNPNRRTKADGYSPYIASSVTHLPNFEGYHQERFEVVKTSLTTMRENAGLDCQILIWDNGSCQEFRDWLLNEYKPDYVVLSNNVGLSNARAGLIRMLPPDVILGVADDDMYYYPDWFKAQVELMAFYPNVGQVSGYPVRTQMRWGNKRTLEWARKVAIVEEGSFIPAEWDRDYCTSIGRDYEWHKKHTENDWDYRITYRGVQAYAFAHHCQFICKVKLLANLMRFTTEAMSDDKPFDWAVDNTGMLRLTTINRYTRHMGNVMDDDLKPKRRRRK
ncbi:MAG: glycosyltransferase [Candidatus Izemoplasmatales bacterium]|nr:glycosyltransferase [Candidatus Izemoplasmatales bacterium]